MSQLTLKVKKVNMVNPQTKKKGFASRVITNGTKTFSEIAEESARNTTVHKAEAKVAAELLLDGISAYIKQGYIIDLGPLGKLYPAVTGKWTEQAEEQQKADLQLKVNYKPSDEIAAAIGGARLAWAADDATDSNDGSDTTDGGTDNSDEPIIERP